MLNAFVRDVIVLLGATLCVCWGAEIHLFDDFGINEDTEGIVEVKGLPFEGKAYLFGDKKENLVKGEQLGNEITKLAKVYDGLAVSANIKMDPNQESTLIWIETIYTRPVFGIWLKCKQGECSLTMLYLLHQRSYEITFDDIGPLDNQRWHKLLVHISGMAKEEQSFVTVHVDCAKRGEKKMLKGYTHLMPIKGKKAITSKTWLAQRALNGGFEKPWRGSLQNVHFVFNRDLTKLTDPITCARLKYKGHEPPSNIVKKFEDNDKKAATEEKLFTTTQHLETVMNNQIDETKYLRRLIENMHYGTETIKKTCALQPCFEGVECIDTPFTPPGYKCGQCPWHMYGDGSHCEDIDECRTSNPCFDGVSCENLSPGYKCGACPKGYRGNKVIGYGPNSAKRKQVCKDIDECAESTAECSRYSKCVNTKGSYRCGACADGYYGDPYKECKRIKYCSKPEFNPCHIQAECIPKHYGRSYACKCKVGYSGDGIKCGIDVDMDGIPNHALACTGQRCAQDNCVLIPNPGQSDLDHDSIGDACDNDIDDDGIFNLQDNCPRVRNPDQKDYDNDGIGDVCDNCPEKPNNDQKNVDDDLHGDACDVDIDNDGTINKHDNCPEIANKRQEDKDGDGVGDHCDNCPNDHNPGQEDEDLNFVGDRCQSVDRDNDGIQDSLDNCPEDANAAQLDSDKDGTGDACDRDDDNDWIIDIHDNCPLIPNRFQKFSASHGRGDICKHDFDGDKVKDKYDACPKDARIHSINFTEYFTFDPTNGEPSLAGSWQVLNKGREVRSTILQQAEPSIFIGDQVFENVQYNGTLFTDSKEGHDMVGLIFGYKSAKSYYVITWKKRQQKYWYDKPFKAMAQPGLIIKEVVSTDGVSKSLRNALWNSEEIPGETSILWKDPSQKPWESAIAYRWLLTLNVPQRTVVFQVYEGTEMIISSPTLEAYRYRGGKLGMFTFAQSDVIWTALSVKCL